jgi:hypothetical protein
MSLDAEKDAEQLREMSENSSMFVFGNSKYMAIGGGGLHYGLSLDESLSKGTTGCCKTFNNPPIGGRPTFEVRNLEIWAII